MKRGLFAVLLSVGLCHAGARPLEAGDLATVRAAANAGSVTARYDLGRMTRQGIGVGRDPARAFDLIASAAQAGHPAAMFTLHNMLAAGEGRERDEAQARLWLDRAAEREYPAALQQLAQNLQYGAAGYERDPARSAHLMAVLAHAMKHHSHAD